MKNESQSVSEQHWTLLNFTVWTNNIFFFFKFSFFQGYNPDFDKSKTVFANEIWQLWWSQKLSVNNDLNRCLFFFMESYCISSENLEYRYVIIPSLYHCRLTTLTKFVFHVRTTETLQYPYE